ncbi:MAG: Hsp20/alpha crystallin family protein [Desulfoarculaceae bacterium]|nr:Hsp20/alpha crystallin family protein [Desulfoarculaceae bacterium]
MAPVSKKLLREIQEMQALTGRMLRNMSYPRMIKVESGLWQPPADIYESGEEITVYCDLAGVTKNSLELLVEEDQVHISGLRQLPRPQATVRIHQLEIELGPFERTVELPAIIDVKQVSSSYLDGILIVSMKKMEVKSQITVRIQVGG